MYCTMVLLSFFSLFSNYSAGQSPEQVLKTVLEVTERGSRGQIVGRVVLTNQSERPISAYVLEIVSEFSDHTEAEAYYTRDYGATPDLNFILPDESREMAFASGAKPDFETVEARVRPVAIIWADTDACGSTKWIEDIFKSRRARILVYEYWSAKLRGLLDRGEVDPERLQSLVDGMERGDQLYTDGSVNSRHPSARNKEKSLASWIRQHLDRARPTVPLERILSSILADFRLEQEALRAHIRSEDARNVS